MIDVTKSKLIYSHDVYVVDK